MILLNTEDGAELTYEMLQSGERGYTTTILAGVFGGRQK